MIRRTGQSRVAETDGDSQSDDDSLWGDNAALPHAKQPR